MKLLTKILLINWHMFTCSEIEVNRNILITGHNGAGKSTLLDAVQYVLTGGRTKFNLAANEDGARRLEGYVRGKLGMESQECLRTGDVVTHIALEFYDEEEKRPFVLGAVIDLPEGGRCSEHFYVIYKTKIQKRFYIPKGNEVCNKRAFESSLRRSDLKYYFAQNKGDARRLVSTTFGLHSKYSDLIPRALAFKPIGDLNDFMFRFLLPEEKVNIDSLRENVRLYRNFEQTLQEQQERLAMLESIDASGRKIEELELGLKISSYINGRIFVNQNKTRLEELHRESASHQHSLRVCEEKEASLRGLQEDIDRQIAGINSQISTMDPGGRIPALEERKRFMMRSFAESQRWLANFQKSYKQDLINLERMRVMEGVARPEADDITDPAIISFLQSMRDRISRLKEENVSRRTEINIELAKAQKDVSEIVERVKVLEQRKHPYEKNVQSLIEILTEQLCKVAGREIHVKPFCEYLEVADEQWRDALEGYLNTQRFDLFVEPAFFRAASRIYEQFKGSLGIYGVGIVDAGKLEAYSEIPKGTLAEKVSVDNIYARRYANLLLGRVVCEEDVELLNTHIQAITPSCMVYRNFTVRAIHPSVYRKPFLGLKAVEMQLVTAREELSQKKTALQLVNRRKKDAEDQKGILDVMDLSYVDSFAQNQQQYITVRDELDAVSRQLEELQNDPNWLTLTRQKEELEVSRSTYTTEIANIQSKSSMLKSELMNMQREEEEILNSLQVIETAEAAAKDELLDYQAEVDRTYESLQKNARYDFNRMAHQNNLRKKQIEDDLSNVIRVLKDEMHDFNLRTSFGFEESLEALGQYRQHYLKLRTVEIEKVRNQSIEARIKCEKSFQEDFISTLRDRINQAKKSLKQLNRSLEDKDFQGDHYAFVVGPSNDPAFSLYYRILCSGEDFQRNTIFMEELSEHNRKLMEELFTKLVATDNGERNERLLQDFTDYRKYMHYDIKITHANGQVTMFSKVNREKSGGETQTPFYVIIAASFDQLAQNRRVASTGCLVLFDEAFNNMDENRIEALMKFYRSLNIQLMIAVPEGRVRNIMPYSDTTLLLVKTQNCITNKAIIHEIES
ncbi:MAG: AAA family ATPase [Firmicutes bacterium]|nr:AAA family ATPase [Bacillota bacterium]